MCYCLTPTLHLNLALTGDGAFLFSLKKTYSVWFISILNYGDTENVLINHLLLVIPVSYPCYYTNLCPHKPHKHAHTHTHTHTHAHTLTFVSLILKPFSQRFFTEPSLSYLFTIWRTFFHHKQPFVNQKDSSDLKGSLWKHLDKTVLIWHHEAPLCLRMHFK